jgi:hypothetical protein
MTRDPAAPSKGLIYVVQPYQGYINVYPLKGHNQKLIGQLSGTYFPFPQGVAVDRQHNLWVTNFTSSYTVEKFPPGATTPSEVLNDPAPGTGSVYYPVAVAVDDDGTVYVANEYYTPSFGPGNIVVYAKGSTNPTQTLTAPSILFPEGIAVDKNHNIFTNVYTTNAQFVIGEFKASSNGSYSYAVINSSPRAFLNYIALDQKGNLLGGSNYHLGQSLLVYGPPIWGQIRQFGGYLGAFGVAFAQKDDVVFAGNLNGHGVVEYSYQSGHQINEIFDGMVGPGSIAVSPPAPLP